MSESLKDPYLWAVSTTGDDFQCVHKDDYDELRNLLIEIAPDWYEEHCGPESVALTWEKIEKAIGGDPFELRSALRRDKRTT